MRDPRSSLLLIVSFLLFLLSFILLCTWGYNAYYKKKDTVVFVKDTAAISKATKDIASATRDSLQKIYIATIQKLDKHFDSTLNYADMLKGSLNAKFAEFVKLKTEISNILKDKSSDANLGLARQKINELQKKIDDLLGKNDEVEAENKRLYAMINQLTVEKVPEQTARPVVFDNKPEAGKAVNIPENTFQAYDLHLSAITVTDDNKELETYQALQTDKFIGSIVVKNNNAINNVAEIFIVVMQPDGHVLQKSAWESGMFETLDGKKIYSCKMRFDYVRGEPKKLLFSLTTDKYMKGNYTMQVYYNGALIGKLYKTLT